MVTKENLFAALDKTLTQTRFSGLGEMTRGKVRDSYVKDGRRFIVTTDRISAFDRVLGTLPFKGQVLNRVASFWFEKTKDFIPNHLVATPDPQVMEVLDCTPMPVEMVVRAYSDRIHFHVHLGALPERLPHVLRKSPARRHEETSKAGKGDPHPVDKSGARGSRRVRLQGRDPGHGHGLPGGFRRHG